MRRRAHTRVAVVERARPEAERVCDMERARPKAERVCEKQRARPANIHMAALVVPRHTLWQRPLKANIRRVSISDCAVHDFYGVR